MRLLSVAFLSLPFIGAGRLEAQTAPEIRVPPAVYTSGERVTASVKAQGDVVIENDLRQRSEKVAVGGAKDIPLGGIPGPGLYTVRVIDRNGAAVAVLLAAPREGGFELAVTSKPIKEPTGLSEEVLRPLVQALGDPSLLREAAGKALKTWLPKNASAVGATTTYCLVCVAPGGQFACPACATSAGANVADLGLEVFVELVTLLEKKERLKPEHAEAIRKVIRYGKSGAAALSLLKADKAIEKAIAGLEFTETVVEHEGVTMVLGNVAGQANKANLLIKITKK